MYAHTDIAPYRWPWFYGQLTTDLLRGFLMASNVPSVSTTVPPTLPSDVRQCEPNTLPDSNRGDSESEWEYEYDDKATEVSTRRDL